MAANIAPIFPISPLVGIGSLAAATACTTRGPIAHGSLGSSPCYAVQVLGTQTNGCRIDKIQVQAISTSITAPTVAQTVLIWASDGSTAYVVDEITVTALTPSTTTPSFVASKNYTNLNLASTWSLWASTTVTTTASTTALAVEAFGGAY